MTTKEAAKKYDVTTRTLIAKAKSKGLLPKRTVQTGKRGRPSLLWTDKQAYEAAR